MFNTLIVADEGTLLANTGLPAISFEHYLSDYPKKDERKTRVINLCDTSIYLSRGYYCSLLAEARQHKVLPSVNTINDLRDASEVTAFDFGLTASIVDSENIVEDETVSLHVYFGWTENEAWKKVARVAFDRYPSPILLVKLSRDRDGVQLGISGVCYSQLAQQQQEIFLERLENFTQRVWRQPAQRKHRWEMAILVDPDEANPPSDKEAINRFIRAAAKVGINAETITSGKKSQILQYDALFIRETTAIDHPTYRLARKAEQEDLVVIDDSTSILRCCNKVFLHDAFSYNNVPSPKTVVMAGCGDAQLEAAEASLGYPMVLKMPEGSFSLGVFKVGTRQELQAKLKELFSDSALVLAQEFLYTEFDWRIGVLNNRAIYACKYHMAKDHWQIYNHGSKRSISGGWETMPTFETPKAVLDAALKACAIIGKSLYGVDIKQKGGQVYVIEVNDNPSIEHNVEDSYLGNELYMQIMQEFANRLEQRGR
jgi:glutathione synthase/RimK-type ligase-like ATP-grasp enzyme